MGAIYLQSSSPVSSGDAGGFLDGLARVFMDGLRTLSKKRNWIKQEMVHLVGR